MADEPSTATEPKPGQPSVEQEQNRAENSTTNQQTERGGQQENGAKGSPPLPPRPIPVPVPHNHINSEKGASLPQHPAVSFAPLPGQEVIESTEVEPPFHPRWYKTKLALMTCSLAVSAVIFGVGIRLGYHVAPWYGSFYGYPVDYEFGLSGGAAGCAIFLVAIEFLTIALSKRLQGMHPGALVTFHLIIWILALSGLCIIVIVVDDYFNDDYEYPRVLAEQLGRKTAAYERVLIAFDALLLVIHFTLFVGACVDTNRLRAARKKTVIVHVPVPYYGDNRQSFVPPPEAQAVPYPFPPMSQVSGQPGQGTDTVPPQAAALYGGYYAPAQPGAAWMGTQQGTGSFQGYYAPVNAPTAPAPASASTSLAVPSGSRRKSRQQAASQPAETRQEQ